MVNIDFHVHVTPPDIIDNWRKYAEKEPYFSLLSSDKHNKFVTAEEVAASLEAGTHSGQGEIFDKAVVFGFGFRDMGLCRYVNDYVIEKVREYPRLIGFISVPPCGDEAVREIKRCHNAGLKGVGELFPAGQEMEIENKKQTDAVCGICKELGLPVLIHADGPVGHYYTGKTDVRLSQLETFITNNPGLDIVLAHWGGGLLFYETMPEIRRKFRNVYYDTAASPFLYDERIYRAAKAMGLCEKIIFGSDFPLLPPSLYFGGLEKSGLSAEEKQLILGGNAQRLLAL
ncbi:MAG: amidohydrolase family protein [Treponema sp.]|jgi:predicted TIM-barrel fold metal-dependent hydrolase|nr:amidohydrolase family protein [Treponema sp.]